MAEKREQIRTPWWSDEVMYWLEDQVAIAFQSPIPFTDGPIPPSKDVIIDSLNLENLDQFLQVRGFKLQSYTSKDVPHPLDENITHPHVEAIEELEREIEDLEKEIEELESLSYRSTRKIGYKSPRQRQIQELERRVEDLEREIENLESMNQSPASRFSRLNSTIGKYIFPLPDGKETVVVAFFNIKPVKTVHPTQDIDTIRILNASSAAQCRCDGDSNTHKVVELINGNLKKLREDVKVPVIAAAPDWLGGANCYIHGCPVFPPLPVPEQDTCTTSPGRWPIQIPVLSSESSPLQEMTGAGVTVFVLDSMPNIKNDPDLIRKAAARAGDKNELLKDIADQQDRIESPFIKFSYQELPDTLKEDALDQLVTGRDLNGKLYGFHMPDHGLFVTGIIRDLANEADIEFVRVLNDFGVGSVSVIIQVLEDILYRMMPINPKTGEKGDLYKKPVQINLSLVLSPPEEDLLRLWFGMDSSQKMGDMPNSNYDSEPLRLYLHMVIQCLSAWGAVFAASAGNDSNWPDMPGRMGPRYPGAFSEVISVGAVDKDQNAAKYSNYPQLPGHHNGIATYGGIVPKQADIDNDNVDAMRGVYSNVLFPEPVAKNPPQQDFNPQDPNAWAYWSGTSFATPVVSAVAARVLQLKANEWPSHAWATGVHRALLTPEGQQELLTGNNSLPTQPLFHVPLLMAYQCEQEEVVTEQNNM
jgi:chaperonin cofactor prefoldin